MRVTLQDKILLLEIKEHEAKTDRTGSRNKLTIILGNFNLLLLVIDKTKRENFLRI